MARGPPSADGPSVPAAAATDDVALVVCRATRTEAAVSPQEVLPYTAPSAIHADPPNDEAQGKTMEGGTEHPQRPTERVVVRRVGPPVPRVGPKGAWRPPRWSSEGRPSTVQGQPEDKERALPATLAPGFRPALIHPEAPIRAP